jgi:hypothetical protein
MSAGGEFAVYRLGDDKAEIVRKALVQPLAPMRCRVGVAKRGLHPDVRVTHFHVASRNIVDPEIEGAAACETEASVMPVAGQDAILDAAALERKAHMWTFDCRARRHGRGRER